MMNELPERLAAEFWAAVGAPSPFPRDLEDVLGDVKAIDVVAIPALSVARVRQALAHLPHSFGLAVRDRRLLGCLIAYRGSASLFIDADLELPERRVIVAHELGHFLGDYEYPRRKAERRVGPQLLRIFDGDRPATEVERLEATITGVDLEPHTHFMARAQDGSVGAPTSRSEQHANDLALELLAPGRDVTATLRQRGPLPTTIDPWCALLEERYGLPPSWARPYADRLLAHSRARRTFSERLGR